MCIKTTSLCVASVAILNLFAVVGCSSSSDGPVAYQPAVHSGGDPLIVHENDVKPVTVDKYYAYRDHYYYYHPEAGRYVQMKNDEKPPKGAEVEHVVMLPPRPADQAGEPQVAKYREGPDDGH